MGADADAVWNRACASELAPGARPGDRALFDLLTLHGSVMNGGVSHALDTRTTGEITAAAAGFRYLGADDLAATVDAMAALSTEPDLDDPAFDDRIDALEERYSDAVPRDQVLVDRFEAVFAARSDDFAPVT